MARYLADNPRAYIFSSITASVDGDTKFEPFNEAGPASNAGRLLIPMTARFLLNDGQHRRAAVEEALRESPELGEETLSVVFFIDAGLRRSQQMFADLNRHTVRPTMSLGILYDHRDPLSLVARSLAETVTVFENMTEMERTSIPNRSNRLHTLSSIYQATRTLLERRRNVLFLSKRKTSLVNSGKRSGKQFPIGNWLLRRRLVVLNSAGTTSMLMGFPFRPSALLERR